MPKVLDDTSGEVKPKRKAVTRKKTESTSTTPRRRTVKKPSANEETLTVSETANSDDLKNKRKAPTRFKEEQEASAKVAEENKKSLRKLYVIGTLVVISFGIASFIGFTDNGQIDVSAVIAERNARVASGNINPEIDGDAPTSIVVPVQNSESQLIDGGLERSTNPPVLESATVPAEVASSSTSTEPISSSTETTGDVATSSEVQSENEDTANEPIDELTPASSTTPS